MASPNTIPARPLDGMRVLEVGQLIAGPFAGCLLAYFGAEVIKIEPPGKGDPLRVWRILDHGTSLWWRSLGRNKKCITMAWRVWQTNQAAAAGDCCASRTGHEGSTYGSAETASHTGAWAGAALHSHRWSWTRVAGRGGVGDRQGWSGSGKARGDETVNLVSLHCALSI